MILRKSINNKRKFLNNLYILKINKWEKELLDIIKLEKEKELLN